MKNLISLIFLSLLLGPGSLALASDKEKELHDKIVQLLELTGAISIGQQMGEAVSQQMILAFREQNPNIPPRAFEIIKEVVVETMNESSGDIIEPIVSLYEKYYSEKDIDAMVSFYNSPVGRKMIETTPAVMQESVQIGGDFGRKLVPAINEEIRIRWWKP